MKDDILNILKNNDKAMDVIELQDALGLKDSKELEELIKILREMEDEALLYHTKKDKYMLLENSPVRKGIMRVNKKGYGFVAIESLKDDVYVSAEDMNGAIHDDIVLVEITSKMNIDRLEGRILKVLKRQVEQYIGEINFDDKGLGHLNLDGDKIKLEIEINKEDSLNAVDGAKVVVELGKKINNTKYKGILE